MPCMPASRAASTLTSRSSRNAQASARQAEALERDRVDLGLRLARADERGVDDDVEDLVDRQLRAATAAPTRARCWCTARSAGRARGAARGSGRTARGSGAARPSAAPRSRAARPVRPSVASSPRSSRAMNSASLISPRSSANSGCTPSCARLCAIASAYASAGTSMPSCSRSKAPSSGDVSTPPKSETMPRIMRVAARRSARCRCGPSMRQRTNAQSSRSCPRSSVEPQTTSPVARRG